LLTGSLSFFLVILFGKHPTFHYYSQQLEFLTPFIVLNSEVGTSVSNTGFLVFGDSQYRYRQNFGGITGIRTYKMGTFDQNYYLLKKILGNIHLIYFVFTCKLTFIIAFYLKQD
jgi:hypothetical protein